MIGHEISSLTNVYNRLSSPGNSFSNPLMSLLLYWPTEMDVVNLVIKVKDQGEDLQDMADL